MRFCIDREDMLLAAYRAVRRRHGMKSVADDQIVTEVAMEAQKGMWEMRDYWIVERHELAYARWGARLARWFDCAFRRMREVDLVYASQVDRSDCYDDPEDIAQVTAMMLAVLSWYCVARRDETLEDVYRDEVETWYFGADKRQLELAAQLDVERAGSPQMSLF